jgi:hypothetical protein
MRQMPAVPYSSQILFGLSEALKRQGRVKQAQSFRERFSRSWANASHTLTSSRF